MYLKVGFLHSHAAEELVSFGYKLISKADCCALALNSVPYMKVITLVL